MVVEPAVQRKSQTYRRWAVMASLAIVIVIAIAALILVIKWPFTREAVIKALHNSSERTVEIKSFRRTYFPPGCVAEGINFLRHDHPDRLPVITMQKMIIRGSYLGLFSYPKRIPEVQVVGLHLTIPARSSTGQSRSVIPLPNSKSGTRLVFGTVRADAAVLEFISSQPGKEPYKVDIQRLDLDEFGGQAPIGFRAMLYNAKPPGEVHASGKLGPWDAEEPSTTPVSGTFTFDQAKLDVFKGISGALSSNGSFKGPLDRIEVEGKADVPLFHVVRSNHSVHVSTTFQAVVNGTDGDTALKNIQSSFLRSTVMAQGDVAGKAGRKGKTLDVAMNVQDGRIEDLLLLFVKSKTAPISGRVSMRSTAELSFEPRPFLEKLKGQADFGIGGSRFTQGKSQAAINVLSESARGEKKEQQKEDPETVLSDLKGHVVLRNGIATFTALTFSVPGASAQVHGTFNLANQQIDLHGILQTTGKLADNVSGFKSLLLKAVNPFFKKRGAAKLIPFKITGTYGHPSVGLELSPKKK